MEIKTLLRTKKMKSLYTDSNLSSALKFLLLVTYNNYNFSIRYLLKKIMN